MARSFVQTTASPAVVSPGLCSSETQERDELVQPITANVRVCPGSAQIPLPDASAVHCPSSPVKRRLLTAYKPVVRSTAPRSTETPGIASGHARRSGGLSLAAPVQYKAAVLTSVMKGQKPPLPETAGPLLLAPLSSQLSTPMPR